MDDEKFLRISRNLQRPSNIKKLYYSSLCPKAIQKLVARGTLLRDSSLTCTIENTTVCNLRCRFCTHPRLNLKGEMISPQMWDLIIAEIKELYSRFPRKRPKIIYGGMGEPLLNPQFLEHLRNIRQELPKARIQIDTNGVVLDAEKTEALVRERLVDIISISLNAPNRELYKKLMLRDKFDTVIKNIYRFVEKRNSSGSDIEISICVKDTDDNRQNNTSIKEQISPILSDIDQFWINDILNWGGGIDVQEIKSNTTLKPIDFPCYGVLLLSTVVIDIHGNVYPCCCTLGTAREESELKLGNIQENHLTDIWERGKHLELKRIMMNGKIRSFPTCANCTVYSDKRHDLFFHNPFPLGPKFF